MRYGCLLATLSSDDITASCTHAKKKNPLNTELCYVIEWSCHLEALFIKSKGRKSSHQDGQVLILIPRVLVATASFCYGVGSRALQMFGPDELSVI